MYCGDVIPTVILLYWFELIRNTRLANNCFHGIMK